MRYNPPPTWPAPPHGWTPEEGWSPDPSWPPAPPGWQFWITDEPTQISNAPSAPSGASSSTRPTPSPSAMQRHGIPHNRAGGLVRRASRARLVVIGAGVLVLLLVAVGAVVYLKTSSSGQTGIPGGVVGFTPDGTLVTTDDEHGPEIRFWNMNTGQETRSPLKLAFSGPPVLSKDGQTVAVWSEGCVAHSPPCPPDWSEAGGPGSRVRLYSTVTGQQTCVIEQSNDSPYNVEFAPDGKTVALSGIQGAASLWDANSCQQTARLKSPTNTNVTVVAISPDGKTLAGGGTSQYVDLWDMATHELEHQINTGQTGNMMAAAFSPDGRLLATSANDGTLRLWDTTTFEETVPPIRPGGDSSVPTVALNIVFSPDGTMLAATAASKGVLVWDAHTGQARTSPTALAKYDLLTIAFSPDGTRIVGDYLDKDKFAVVSAKLA
jgi:WD40 repeat protein